MHAGAIQKTNGTVVIIHGVCLAIALFVLDVKLENKCTDEEGGNENIEKLLFCWICERHYMILATRLYWEFLGLSVISVGGFGKSEL